MNILDLPIEILQQITYHSGVLDCSDVLNLMLTNKTVCNMLRHDNLDLAYHRMLTGLQYCIEKVWPRECYMLSRIDSNIDKIDLKTIKFDYTYRNAVLRNETDKNKSKYNYYLKYMKNIADYSARNSNDHLTKYIIVTCMRFYDNDLIDVILNENYEYRDYFWNRISHNMLNDSIYDEYCFDCILTNSVNNNLEVVRYILNSGLYNIDIDDLYDCIYQTEDHISLQIILEYVDPVELDPYDHYDMFTYDPSKCMRVLLDDERFRSNISEKGLHDLLGALNGIYDPGDLYCKSPDYGINSECYKLYKQALEDKLNKN